MVQKAHFITQGEKVTHPDIVDEGLELYYDTKGKKNSDRNRNALVDMSGNTRHGTLHNFAYEKLSGYDKEGGLVFDGTDDTLELGEVEGVEVVSATKNLFPSDYFTQFTSTDSDTYESVYLELKPNTTYTMSSNTPGSTTGLSFENRHVYLETQAQSDAVFSGHPVTKKTDNDGILRLDFYTGRKHTQGVINGDFQWQLEEGSTATPYVPYIPTAKMTYQLNNNVISYGEDGTVKWVKDGKVMERKGVNLVKNSSFNNLLGWVVAGGTSYQNSNNELTITKLASSGLEVGQEIDIVRGNKYYMTVEMKTDSSGDRMVALDRAPNTYESHSGSGEWEKLEIISNPEDSELYPSPISFRFLNTQREGSIADSPVKLRKPMVIDLTATFGKGNEPTLEEIQSEPDKWQWLPNPMDLLENKELKGNIVGDLEDVVDAEVRDQQSGTEIYTDKADDSVVHVEIDGKSYQHAGSGKNLFNLHTIPRTVSSSLLLTNETTNGFIVESTNTTSWQYIYWELSSELLPGKTYTIKLPFSILSGDISDTYGQIYLDGTFLGAMKKEADSFILTFSTTGLVQDQTKLEFRLYVNGISNVSVKKIEFYNIQLEEGSTSTAYEPPAPTPDYPVEIHSVNDFDVVSSVGKENLLKGTHGKQMGSPTYASDIRVEDGRLAIAFESSNNITTLNQAGSRYSMKDGEKYTFSFYAKASEDLILKSVYMNGKNNGFIPNTPITTSWERYYFTFTHKGDNSAGIHMYPTIHDGNGNYKTFYVTDWKLEEGELSPYTQAPEDITEDDNHPLIDKINLLLSEPLRSVGDVKDRLFIDSDGLWKIERNIHEQTFTKVVQHYTNNKVEGLTRFRVDTPAGKGINRANFTNMLTNMFEVLRANLGYQADRLGFSAYSAVGQNNFFYGTMPTDLLATEDVAGLNSFFEDNPLTIIFELESNYVEVLGQEIQDKLNNLRSFQDSNYVYTVINDDNMPSYVKDNLKPRLHATFMPADYYKENRYISNLLIHSRPLTDGELLQNYRVFKRRHPI